MKIGVKKLIHQIKYQILPDAHLESLVFVCAWTKKGRIERIISQLLDLCSKRSSANVSSIVYGHHYHRALTEIE